LNLRPVLSRFVIFSLFLLCLPTFSYCHVIYRGTDLSKVALTFDDGPSPIYTQKVLDILKKNNIKATFFVIGNKVAKYPELTKKIADEGHEIENHTYFHSRLSENNTEQIIQELDKTSSIVEKITGKGTRYFRPPFGTITREAIRPIEKAGYRIVMWYGNADDFYHEKWGMRRPASIARRILSQLRGGGIILMHDDSSQIVTALPMIIDEIRKKGYSFARLDEILKQ
jgi:peptidoglycan-N-acetylglucosamine deacetylase